MAQELNRTKNIWAGASRGGLITVKEHTIETNQLGGLKNMDSYKKIGITVGIPYLHY